MITLKNNMPEQETKTTEAVGEEVKKQELNNRLNSFVKEYGELVAKHKVDFATYPVFMPDGNGAFKVIMQSTPVDITNQPTKSPFVAKA